MSNILNKTGLYNIYKIEDFYERSIKLRDGRDAILWVSKIDGHGILDDKFWENSDFYSSEYRNQFSANLNSYASPEEHLLVYKDVNKRQFNQFKNLINSETKFLEIGSSFGGILKYVSKLKMKTCQGLEPNIEDSKFTSKNYDIINSLFEDYNFLDEKYNLIVSFEVLEHVYDIKIFLEKLLSILDKGGRVNIEVPNHNDALLVNYKVDRYQSFYYHKSHVHYFTEKSLLNIFSHFGIIGEVVGFQMYPFFNQVYWLYNNSPQESSNLALSYPPTVDENLNNKEIYRFFINTNKKYQKLVEKNLSSDCLVFKGYKK